MVFLPVVIDDASSSERSHEHRAGEFDTTRVCVPEIATKESFDRQHEQHQDAQAENRAMLYALMLSHEVQSFV